MGIGDQIMATGLARGAKARGKRIAFGDGKRIIWDGNSEPIFRGNPNIAKPGSEQDNDIEWIGFHKGSRIYNSHKPGDPCWTWNHEFRAAPGEIYFSDDEDRFAESVGRGFIVIEPNIPEKLGAINKRWPVERYDDVARKLMHDGYDVRQFSFGLHRIDGVKQIKTKDFRHAARVLKNAALYIGPEGGLHHASAAVGIPAVVLFGGFIPPAVTGYGFHTNLTGGATKFCGSLGVCRHCLEAMDAISVADVTNAARGYLKAAT